MAIFEGEKLSNDIINNDTMSDDEVVASYVPPRYLFLHPSWGTIKRADRQSTCTELSQTWLFLDSAVKFKLYEFLICSIRVTTMNAQILSQAVPIWSQNARTDRVVFLTTGSAMDTRIAMTEVMKIIAVKYSHSWLPYEANLSIVGTIKTQGLANSSAIYPFSCCTL